jgi:hypothetical protein
LAVAGQKTHSATIVFLLKRSGFLINIAKTGMLSIGFFKSTTTFHAKDTKSPLKRLLFNDFSIGRASLFRYICLNRPAPLQVLKFLVQNE